VDSGYVAIVVALGWLKR